MKRILFSLLIAVTMLITGCDDTLYEVYNDFTGPVESVALPTAMSVEVHTSEKLKASVYPTMTENKNVTWSSADSSIASVDSDGVITGNIVNQSTMITVTTEEGGFTAQCKVTVVPKPIPITKITLPETLSIGTGQQRTLSYLYTPSDATKATNSYMTWTSSNTAVAAVDGEGNITGVSNGTAVVTVKSTEWDKTATCTVTVGDPTYMVTYNANYTGGPAAIDGGSYKTGESFTVSAGTIFAREHYTFSGWKTKADGTGTPYTAGASYPMGTSDIVLYAQWTLVSYTVTYVCTDNTRGTVPTVQSYHYGDTVTVQSFNDTTGGLIKTDGTAAYYCSWMEGSTERAEGSTFMMPGNNVTLTVKWNQYTATYNAVPLKGPAGGRVVYDSLSYGAKGWRYIEMAPASTEIEAVWGSSGTDFANGTTTPAGLGYGPANTTYLVGKSSPAAIYCDNLSVAGYTDWFLPSIDELTQMLITNYTWNKAEIALTDGARYWSSSSDDDDDYLHAQDYIYSSPWAPYNAQDMRNWDQKVRAARRF